MTSRVLVCLRCERSFKDLDPDNPPLQCPNCGREAYWAERVDEWTTVNIRFYHDGQPAEVTLG